MIPTGILDYFLVCVFSAAFAASARIHPPPLAGWVRAEIVHRYMTLQGYKCTVVAVFERAQKTLRRTEHRARSSS
jgi:hypothetical protein